MYTLRISHYVLLVSGLHDLIVKFPLFLFFRQTQVLSHQRRATVTRRFQEVHEIGGLSVRSVPIFSGLQSHSLHTTPLQLRFALFWPALLAQAEARASRIRTGVSEVQAD